MNLLFENLEYYIFSIIILFPVNYSTDLLDLLDLMSWRSLEIQINAYM